MLPLLDALRLLSLGNIGFLEFLYAVFTFVVAVTVALTIHEFAHAVSAFRLGDKTAYYAGRVTLNPLAHYDPIGTTMILLMGMGWGKPVPVTEGNLKNPRWDSVKVSLWGPLSNLILATALLLLIKHFPSSMPQGDRLFANLILLNLYLAFFNLIPIFPLDGYHILLGLLPRDRSRQYYFFMQRWGLLVLILILFTGIASSLVNIGVRLFLHLPFLME